MLTGIARTTPPERQYLLTLQVSRYCLSALQIGNGEYCAWSIVREGILLYIAFCTLGQYRDRRKPEAGTMPPLFFQMTLVHSTIDSTVHSLRVCSNSRFFAFGLYTLRTEHFEGLKHIPHRSSQSCNADRSFCSCS